MTQAYLLVAFEWDGVGGHCLGLVMLWNGFKCLVDYYLVCTDMELWSSIHLHLTLLFICDSTSVAHVLLVVALWLLSTFQFSCCVGDWVCCSAFALWLRLLAMELLCVAHIIRLVSYGLLLFFYNFCIYYHWLLQQKKGIALNLHFWQHIH